mgnify:CR=1 FL=1
MLCFVETGFKTNIESEGVCVKQTGPPHAPPFWPGGVTEDPENLPEPVHRVGGTNRIL